MKIPFKMPRLKGFRFPREVIAYAVWAFHRFALSTADVEDLLAECGVTVSRETNRQWVNRFGGHFCELHQARPASRGRQMAFGRSGHLNRQSEMLALAGGGCERRYS